MELGLGDFPEPPEPTPLPPLTYENPTRGDVGITKTKTYKSADPEYYKKAPNKTPRVILPGFPEISMTASGKGIKGGPGPGLVGR